MEALEDYKKMVVGKTLTNLFFTKQDGPHDYRPGILPAYYFSTILELDNSEKLLFGHDFMVEWQDELPVITLTNENWELPGNLVFKGQQIVDLTRDEYEQLTFHLANGTTIAHTIDYGDQLFIKNEKQENERRITAPDRRRKWWQRLFGWQ